jgi:nicotinamidase-related amidase
MNGAQLMTFQLMRFLPHEIPAHEFPTLEFRTEEWATCRLHPSSTKRSKDVETSAVVERTMKEQGWVRHLLENIMKMLLILGSVLVFVALAFSMDSQPAAKGRLMKLELRTQVQPFHGGDSWAEADVEQSFPTARTAIIITDMWDKHWCRGATVRVGEIARRMEPLVEKARASGILIIHAPSDTMSYYADTPGRRLAEDAPHFVPPEELTRPNPPLPIDDSDGGCDTPGDKEHRAWSRETPLLTIGPGDVVSDNGAEIYNVLRQHHISTVFFMGVHANMCILNRTFGIRQLTKWGLRCVLVRDLTDAMYDSASRPYVSHAAGTELVIEYIERYWAPTITSAQMLAALSR